MGVACLQGKLEVKLFLSPILNFSVHLRLSLSQVRVSRNKFFKPISAHICFGYFLNIYTISFLSLYITFAFLLIFTPHFCPHYALKPLATFPMKNLPKLSLTTMYHYYGPSVKQTASTIDFAKARKS